MYYYESHIMYIIDLNKRDDDERAKKEKKNLSQDFVL